MAADKALGIALDLAQQHNASLALMHVLLHDKEPDELLRLPDLDAAGAEVVSSLNEIKDAPEPEHTAAELMGDPGAPNRPVNDDLLRKIGDHVLTRAKAQAAEQGIDAQKLEIQDGRPAEAIVAAAEAAGADTIVMGTRGLRMIEAMAFGSVSQEVCRTASCSCIAVH